MSDDEAPDLSTVTSEQLIEELASRASAMVIGFDPLANDDDSYMTRQHGNVLSCAGLARRIMLAVDRGLENSTLDEDDD